MKYKLLPLFVLFGLISHLTFAVKVAEELPTENAKQSSQRQSRTLGTIADIFLSATCNLRDCIKSQDRASFCCKRNFNARCCYYATGYNNYRPNYINNYIPHNDYGPWQNLGNNHPYNNHWHREKPGSCPPAKYPDDYFDDYYTRNVDPYYKGGSYDGYFPIKDNVYYPNLSDIRRRRRTDLKNRAAYKVLKRRRAKMLTYEDHQHNNFEPISEMLTPAPEFNSRHFYGHHEECRYDYDCFGSQKCCHVQVAKHRFRLSCRHPRMNYF